MRDRERWIDRERQKERETEINLQNGDWLLEVGLGLLLDRGGRQRDTVVLAPLADFSCKKRQR